MVLKPSHHLTLTVAELQSFGKAVRRIVLRDPDGWELPRFTAGAHIDVHLPQGGVRQFSLSGDPAVRDRYELAVLARRDGRGGSSWIHDSLAVGDTVYASLPRNHFPLDTTFGNFILLAGGIGITPLRSMTFELARLGKPFQLWYCARDEAHAPYADELRARVPGSQLRLQFSNGRTEQRLDLVEVLANVRHNTAVYCCGPHGFMRAAREATRHWPDGSIRFEAFSAAADDIRTGPGFDVVLARSGRTIPVRGGQSILNALREHDVEVESSCEAGVCRSCKTDFSAGVPVHRDLVLSADERRKSMLICVSGCSSDQLVLER